MSIPINRHCTKLHILGQVTLTAGFPSSGLDGDTVATYTLQYSGGRTTEIPLRNGYEVAQANLIQEATRIDPQTTESQRAITYVKETAREHYQVLLYSIPVEDLTLASIRCRLVGQQPPLALFAITTETAARFEKRGRTLVHIISAHKQTKGHSMQGTGMSSSAQSLI